MRDICFVCNKRFPTSSMSVCSETHDSELVCGDCANWIEGDYLCEVCQKRKLQERAGEMLLKIQNGFEYKIKIDFNECPRKDELIKEFNAICKELYQSSILKEKI